MAGISDFRFLGTVMGDCTLKELERTKVANFSIAVRTPFKKEGKSHFPIAAFGTVAEIASVLCRNGAKVAVTGMIVSQDYLDTRTGETYVRTFFYAGEIMRIAKPPRKSLSEGAKRFSELTGLSPIDPPHMPKEKRK